MRPLIVLPLADGEEKRVPNFDVSFVKIQTHECVEKFRHQYWSEIGKYLTFIREFNFTKKTISEEERRRTYGVIQNRRFFKNLDQLKIYSENEVILAKQEWLGGQSILAQFKSSHPKYFHLFLDVCKKINADEDLLNISMLSPHNIFLSKLNFFYDYGVFLEEVLTPYFDPNENEKVGAFIGERLLFIFAHTYFKVRTAPIITLPKISK